MAGFLPRVAHPLSLANRVRPPLVFAHRGGRALGPENTLAGLDLGMAAGADGLEFDVRVSRDGVPVLHHDPDLDRCTNACGPVESRTAAELARVDAAYWFDEAHGPRRIVCMTALENEPSIRLAARLGFTPLREADLADGEVVKLFERLP